jgi:hypothetical protein
MLKFDKPRSTSQAAETTALHTIGDYPIDLLLVRCGTSKLVLAEHSNNLHEPNEIKYVKAK